MSTASACVLSLGSINYDIQVRADRWPAAGETALARDLFRGAGGKAANRAVGARRLGAPALLIGRIGADDLGAEVRRALREADVELDYVATIRSESTGVAIVVVREDGDKTILLVPGANHSWPESDTTVVHAISTAAPGSVLTLDLEASPAIALEAARTARARGLAVVLDPSPAPQMIEGLYGLVDVVTPNASEAATLTGVRVEDVASAVQAGERLRARGVGYACVKLPGGGCVLVGAGQPLTLPPLAVPVVDTTGAGDAFAAALAVAWLKGQAPAQAAALATVAASLAVGGYGAQPAYPDRAALERGLTELEHQGG